MILSSFNLQDLTNHYYQFKNKYYFNPKSGMSEDIQAFINFTDEAMFREYFAEIAEEKELYELPRFYGLHYPIDEEPVDHQTTLTQYTNELNRIKGMYNFCEGMRMIVNDSITEEYVNSNRDHFSLTIEEIRLAMQYVQSAIAALHCEITNNPVGYFQDQNDSKQLSI
jgi:hypothetical protein